MDTTQSQTRVLGIDPGLNVTGYGVIDVGQRGPNLVEAGVVRGRRGEPLSERLHQIHQGITDIVSSMHPNVMALEELYSHYERPTTAILMGHARGVICLAAQTASIATHHYAATKVKKIVTGNGRAPKSQVQHAVMRELRLDKIPEPSDVADALAIALCHYFLSSNERLDELSVRNRFPKAS